MKLTEFNALSTEQASALLKSCCGSDVWAKAMMSAMPFRDAVHLVDTATGIWYDQCNEADWKEAFSHHPKIGDLQSLKEKFASTAHMAAGEQAGAAGASESELIDLANGNKAYGKKFGFIFIVSASGKSAAEMAALITMRMNHHRDEELQVAMGEQHKITLLRLQKQIDADWSAIRSGQITTHVLDTAIGKPGNEIRISLHSAGDSPACIAAGITNADGRIPDLLPKGRVLPPGFYKMKFQTKEYFGARSLTCFYPHVDITFEVFDASHYHIPLLISPFGFSTYRGS